MIIKHDHHTLLMVMILTTKAKIGGAPVWGVHFRLGSGSLARVAPLFLRGLTFSWYHSLTKSARDGIIILDGPTRSPK